MSFDTGGRPLDQFENNIVGRRANVPKLASYRRRPIPPIGMHLQTFGDAWSVVHQTPDSLAQRVRQRVREGGEEDPGVGMRPGKVNGAVKRDDRLSGTGRPRDSGRAAVFPLHNPPLRPAGTPHRDGRHGRA